MTCWCDDASLVEPSKMENAYQNLYISPNSLMFFCCIPCKPLSISTAINNIVIIISTYRSYEYYKVCSVCLSSFIRLHALSCVHIALHLCPYIGKCQQNGCNDCAWLLCTSLRFMFENVLARALSCSLFVWRIFEKWTEWKRPCTWMKDKHAHCHHPNKNKTIEHMFQMSTWVRWESKSPQVR